MSHVISYMQNEVFTPTLIGLADLLKEMRLKRKLQRDIRITMKELSALTDRELNDMGITRGDIYHIAHSSAQASRSAHFNKNQNLKGWV